MVANPTHELLVASFWMRHDSFLCLLDHRGPKFDFCLADSHHPTPKFDIEIYFRYVNCKENYPPRHAKISSTNFSSKTCFSPTFFFVLLRILPLDPLQQGWDLPLDIP